MCLRSHLVDEGMCRTAVGGEGDGAKLDVEALVVDDLVGELAGLVLGLGVDVGGGTTCSLTRRLIDVGVDGGWV